MASYKRIAVFGATGRIGREVTRALAEGGFDVVPLSRQKTTVAGVETQPLGSLEGLDVVVSTVGIPGKAAQNDLIKQAKREGVKRFIASEYGVHPDTNFGRADFFAAKREMRQLLDSSDFADGWTGIACGFFDDIMPVLVSPNTKESTIVVRGTAQVRHPFTLRSDVGRVLAETFREPQRYKNSWITVVNSWYTLGQLAEKIVEFSGRKWAVQTVPTDMKLPILHLAEQNQWDVLPKTATPEEAPVKLEDFEEKAIRPFAESLL